MLADDFFSEFADLGNLGFKENRRNKNPEFGFNHSAFTFSQAKDIFNEFFKSEGFGGNGIFTTNYYYFDDNNLTELFPGVLFNEKQSN